MWHTSAMKQLLLGYDGPAVPVLMLGCMRLSGMADDAAARTIGAALDCGITAFDHADIYGNGESERVFARAIRHLGRARSSLFLQSKCGIVRGGYFDFSRDHITGSVDGILQRLETDHLDALLLHRPDALMEPEEVAAAFDALHRAGKVRHFGVSNQHPGQIALLQASVRQRLIVNQVQMSLAHAPGIEHGFNVNMLVDGAVDRDGGLIEYCRLHRITVQPWSPLQHGFFKGVFLDHPAFAPLNEVLRRIAGEQGVTPAAVAIAWLLRHPAGFQPILGSMNPDRIREMARAPEVALSRPQWYELYRAAGRVLP